jgi:cell division protein FtsB
LGGAQNKKNAEIVMAKKIGYKVVAGLLVGELLVFVVMYVAGGQGLRAVHALQHENQELYAELVLLKKDVDALEVSLKEWHEKDFYKEKIAREQLQMARAGDTVYYIS